ncbi:MAG: Dam family site-specific DNA-(adenine-N6)-methyltransferase [Neisseriaceae bacterium]|nr:Dam family site-specific DNA-(adenine-N6)-methyltransferase [Neisseriaceae bacterium]
MNYIKSPLNYIGGKYHLLPQMLPLFPKKIDTFVDVFSGGFNVGINICANKIILNDNLTYLIELFDFIKKNELKKTICYIEDRIFEFGLSKTNETGYLELRKQYNQNKHPLDLFVLTAFSFNHQIRFNNKHEFNTPFGKERSSYNEKMKCNLIDFIRVLQNSEIEISNLSFELLDYNQLRNNDFVYFDPPYLITTGTYNDGKRGFKGWGVTEEYQLLEILDTLDKKNISFALSNVLFHKGKENEILQKWLNQRDYYIHDLNMNYANSSYHTKNREKNASREVLITNYPIEMKQYALHW